MENPDRVDVENIKFWEQVEYLPANEEIKSWNV